MNPQERLQPSLLDRLIDDEPDKKKESREARTLSLQNLRQAVKRDLGWLFNTTCLGSVRDLSPYPHAVRSVLNFGIPDLTGKAVSGVDLDSIRKLIRQAILDFEPRILRETLRVDVVADRSSMSHNAVRFDIEGELWAEPVPLRVFLQSDFDFESGHVQIAERTDRSGA